MEIHSQNSRDDRPNQEHRSRVLGAVFGALGLMMLVSMVVVKTASPAALTGAASVSGKFQPSFVGNPRSSNRPQSRAPMVPKVGVRPLDRPSRGRVQMQESVDDEAVPSTVATILPASVEASLENMRKIVGLMDLTSLGDDDTEESILKLIDQGKNNAPLNALPAAFCIYDKFVGFAKSQLTTQGLDSNFPIATVVNFPGGTSSLEKVEAQILTILEGPVDEIDLVIPYNEYLSTPYGIMERDSVAMIRMAKSLCAPKGVLLKVILETGEFAGNPALIEQLAQDAVSAGADFIKTSTGKVRIGATQEAAEVMLKVIKADWEKKKEAAATPEAAAAVKPCGFKASGGISDYQAAVQYMKLAADLLGEDYVNPRTFRLGVSGLMVNLVRQAKQLLGEEFPTMEGDASESDGSNY